MLRLKLRLPRLKRWGIRIFLGVLWRGCLAEGESLGSLEILG
jgi:hypothetical protein